MDNINSEKLINPIFDTIGYIQVYTGNGKGKTTASLGLSMRALGRGWKVMLIMFGKGGDDYGELYSFRELSPNIKKNLDIHQFGLDRIAWANNIQKEDLKEAATGWDFAKNAINSQDYQLIILDEINIMIDLKLIALKEVTSVLDSKPQNVEIVLTGRNAHPEIIKRAHLVSEIQPVKHYWNIGLNARKGIEY